MPLAANGYRVRDVDAAGPDVDVGVDSRHVFSVVRIFFVSDPLTELVENGVVDAITYDGVEQGAVQ